MSDERERVRAALIAAGLSFPKPAPVAGQLTEAERAALAARVSSGTPISHIIIRERRECDDREP